MIRKYYELYSGFGGGSTMLRKEDIERIEREAKENYSALFNCSNAAYTANEVVQNCINSYAAGAKAEAEKANELVEALKKKLEFNEIIYRAETERLRDELLQLKKEHGVDPYWYWPQCDVDGCESVSCCGGSCWNDTGYWSVCPNHSQEFRDGKPQPKMKQSAIDKEATRDKETGCLP